MKNGNHAKGLNKKSIALVAAVALMLVGVIGGTIAWLTDDTDPVINTFTPSDVDVELAETNADGGDANANSYKMVPGATIAKDPKVTVKANSEACYVFVKIEESTNFDTFMTYTMAEGWNEVSDADGVYYREVAASAKDQTFDVIAGDIVTVNNTVTKAMMNGLTDATNPTLTFTAYAIQKENLNVTAIADIWDLAQTDGSTATT